MNKGSLWITGSSLVYKFIRLYLLAPPCRLITEDYLLGADICFGGALVRENYNLMNTECALLFKIPSPRAHSTIEIIEK